MKWQILSLVVTMVLLLTGCNSTPRYQIVQAEIAAYDGMRNEGHKIIILLDNMTGQTWTSTNLIYLEKWHPTQHESWMLKEPRDWSQYMPSDR